MHTLPTSPRVLPILHLLSPPLTRVGVSGGHPTSGHSKLVADDRDCQGVSIALRHSAGQVHALSYRQDGSTTPAGHLRSRDVSPCPRRRRSLATQSVNTSCWLVTFDPCRPGNPP